MSDKSTMISTEEAKKIIAQEVSVNKTSFLPLELVSGGELARDVCSPIAMPMFNQSAMDGYALKMGDENVFNVLGEIQAGDDATSFELKIGEAIRIFTGAMCPSSADMVCRIEDITEHDNRNRIEVNVMPSLGANIRLEGEQIKKGEVALSAGHLMNAASIGFLAGLGISEVEVVTSPKIGILATGNELSAAGDTLQPGKIYESNSIMLQCALKENGFVDVYPSKTKDDLNATASEIGNLLKENDVLIITGGISVGDYDYVAEALQINGVTEKFHKVNQKPGKPFYFGTKDGKLIFALPGNPAAVLTCFYVYVLPALHAILGKGFKALPSKKMICKDGLSKSISREQFLKAKYAHNEVEILEGQSSAMLRTFATANCLIYLEAHKTITAGSEVEVLIIR